MADRLANYVPVAERLTQAQGEIIAVEADPPTMLTDAMGYIRVAVYLGDGRKATGTASFRLDLQGKSAQATNPIEDCETSAVGRALAMLGYSSSKSIASREEVREAQRRAEASYAPPSAAPRQPLAPGVHARPQIARDPQPATRKPPTRLGMLARIQELTEEAVGLDLEIDLAKPLDQMTDEELIQHGRNLGRAVAEAQARDLAPAA